MKADEGMRPRRKDRFSVSLSEMAAEAALVDLPISSCAAGFGPPLPRGRSSARPAPFKASRFPRFVRSSPLSSAAVVPAGAHTGEPPHRLRRSRAPAPSVRGRANSFAGRGTSVVCLAIFKPRQVEAFPLQIARRE